ncbi:cytochrome P450 [Sinorhizobium fredii]|uniref:Cytochrome P450-pinF2, plant-inducible n=1 Tax=Sinorhizobium fredii (strain USDA 257) TaxID=1185652 RepID=I3X5R8_SINF2|nr:MULTISPECIES: cytochrome P450 [Sinorhizobium]AFL51224.1 cytochrome P450-pinF2, plant-inducible [Sinorhizobium fredii USDA 257]PDT80151.1 cytochrome P450 [Sinorhizobium sp. BJ1]
MALAVPVVSDIAFSDLLADPYPIYKRLRDMASAVYVDTARLALVTRFDDIMTIERDSETFASSNPGSLVNKVMGHTMMRKDGEAHAIERRAIEVSFRPGTIKNHWAAQFEAISDRLVSEIESRGEADLFDALAAPMASLALIELLGLKDLSWQTLAHWSQALMDGAGNYSGDPAISARATGAAAGVDAAIDAVLPWHRQNPNPAVLSSMVNADHPMNLEQIRANIKVIIGGGLNEPRDSILSLTLGLLSNPVQLATVMANPDLWPLALDEAVRWISPIGMYPRRVTRDVELSGVELRAGDQLGLCVGAANRDDRRFENPDNFDLFRPKQPHLAFGAGPHFCAGAWVARQMVGRIVVPMLFSRLKNLRLQPDAPARIHGWVFRGPVFLPVAWDV